MANNEMIFDAVPLAVCRFERPVAFVTSREHGGGGRRSVDIDCEVEKRIARRGCTSGCAVKRKSFCLELLRGDLSGDVVIVIKLLS